MSNSPQQISAQDAFRLNWQKKLLPVMTAMIMGLTLFFFAASFFQLYFLHKQVQNCPVLEIAPPLAFLPTSTLPGGQPENLDILEAVQWKTMSLLEANALNRRYHQANVLLMARIWVRYLGFVTGMVLALVGAVFILGKMREQESNIDLEGGGIKGHITTASPGLILAFIGTVLMVVTIVTHHNIVVKDGPLYTSIPYLARQQKTKPADSLHLNSSSSIKKKETSEDKKLPAGSASAEDQHLDKETLRLMGITQ